ncbi:MAG: helix-turn-helix domain-containing protein [Sciscionella sp.]
MTARKAAGLTQEDLAAALRVERSTVVRWEAGQHAPQSYLWPKLARVLQVSGKELGELLSALDAADEQRRSAASPTGLPAGSPIASWSTLLATAPPGDAGKDQQAGGSDLLPFFPVGDTTERRQALKLLGTSAVGAGVAHVGLGPFMQSAVEAMEFTRRAEASRLGPKTLDHLEPVVTDMAAGFAHTPPHELFPKARWYRHQVEELIAGQHTLREGQELYRYAGWLGIVLAWTVHDLGDPVSAEAHCLDAWGHGWQAEDNEICALAMDARGTIAMYNSQPNTAKDAAERGLSRAPNSSAAAVRVSAQLARACAKLGQVDQFETALNDARRRLDQLDHQGAGLFSVDSGRLASYAASSYIWLGQPDRAVPYAEDAIDFYSSACPAERSPTREAISRLDLALAYAGLRQTDGVAAQTERALSSERITGSVVSRLGDLTTHMQRTYPQLSTTKDLTERHRELTIALSRPALPDA